MTKTKRFTISEYLLIGVVVFGVVVSLFSLLGPVWLWGMKPGEAALYGDSMGFVNALFSSLAFAGVILALFVQIYEMRLTWDEINDSREAQQQLARQAFFTSIATATDTWSKLAERQKIERADMQNTGRATVAAKEHEHRVIVEELLAAVRKTDPDKGELPKIDFNSEAVLRSKQEAKVSKEVLQIAVELDAVLVEIRFVANESSSMLEQRFEMVRKWAETYQEILGEVEPLPWNAIYKSNMKTTRGRLAMVQDDAQKALANLPTTAIGKAIAAELNTEVNEMIQSIDHIKTEIHILAFTSIGCYVNDTRT